MSGRSPRWIQSIVFGHLRLSISGTTLRVNGLTKGSTYAFRIYYKHSSSGNYASTREPESGTVTLDGETWTFDASSLLTESGTYTIYVNAWNTKDNIETNTVAYAKA